RSRAEPDRCVDARCPTGDNVNQSQQVILEEGVRRRLVPLASDPGGGCGRKGPYRSDGFWLVCKSDCEGGKVAAAPAEVHTIKAQRHRQPTAAPVRIYGLTPQA